MIKRVMGILLLKYKHVQITLKGVYEYQDDQRTQNIQWSRHTYLGDLLLQPP